MNKRSLNIGLAALSLGISSLPAAPSQRTDSLKIQRVSVSGAAMPLPSRGDLNLGTHPGNVQFVFGSANQNIPSPLRLRAKLEGFESDWHEGSGYMFMALRFFNVKGDQIGQTNFQVSGESAGWNGSVETSPLTHRHESVVVPPPAAYVWVLMSSAGPPSVVGLYAVANLTLTEESEDSPPVQLIKPTPDCEVTGMPAVDPRSWQCDGTHQSMAKIIDIGHDPAKRALAIVDDDPTAHAEWHNVKGASPIVHPGRRLILDWYEMYSMGVADLRSVLYPELDAGAYRFRVIGINLLGQPDGTEDSIGIIVAQPFWKRPSTLLFAGIFFVAALTGGFRYNAWIRMRREMLVLRNQQAMEQERLRIARDIHDDLGARVTQISMLAASALDSSSAPDAVQTDLHQIKQISRDLISALYETVWTVNPDYDNLSALGDYLCQMVDKLCKRASLRCRLDVSVLPEEVQVSGQIRHNLAMAMKEAINNAIKHAQCSEIAIRIIFDAHTLQIEIRDNGVGFVPADTRPGNGLSNMKHRLEDISGNCTIESGPGHGALVRLSLDLGPTQQGSIQRQK